MSADNRPEEHIRKVSRCIRRIAFFGTPHLGSDKAKWAEMGRRFIDHYIRDPNKELAKDLEKKSEKLAGLGREFPNLLRRRADSRQERIEILCFFEGKEYKVGLKRVGKV